VIKMRRSRLEIYMGILKFLACRGPSKLTHIMYETMTNHKNMKQCIEFLTKKNLVEAVGEKRNFYRITEKGIATLETLNKLELMVI